MPDASGYELAKEIRARYGEVKPMLIAISGRYKQASDKMLGQIVGFDFFFSSRRRHTMWNCDWSSDVCSSDLPRVPRAGVPMIISYQHRFIFFAIPKTGTHSVRQALRPHLGPQDLEQVGLFVQKRFPFKAFEGIRHGHISAREILPVLGEDTFARYFKFAFARNPFDRFVSYCAFMGREDRAFESAPRDFMRYIVHERKPVNHLLYRPQHELVVDSTGRLAMDYVGRTEDMQGGYDEVCRRL